MNDSPERRGLELESESATDLGRESCQSIGNPLKRNHSDSGITMRIMIDHEIDDDSSD